MKIYIVTDTESDEIISINQSERGARKALLHHLKTECYTPPEWRQIAAEVDYESVGLFDAAILNGDDFDDDLRMAVAEWEVEE